jgi:hypothetical protein
MGVILTSNRLHSTRCYPLSIFFYLQSTDLSLIITLHNDAAGEGEIFDLVFQNLVYYKALGHSSLYTSTEGGESNNINVPLRIQDDSKRALQI